MESFNLNEGIQFSINNASVVLLLIGRQNRTKIFLPPWLLVTVRDMKSALVSTRVVKMLKPILYPCKTGTVIISRDSCCTSFAECESCIYTDSSPPGLNVIFILVFCLPHFPVSILQTSTFRAINPLRSSEVLSTLSRTQNKSILPAKCRLCF